MWRIGEDFFDIDMGSGSLEVSSRRVLAVAAVTSAVNYVAMIPTIFKGKLYRKDVNAYVFPGLNGIVWLGTLAAVDLKQGALTKILGCFLIVIAVWQFVSSNILSRRKDDAAVLAEERARLGLTSATGTVDSSAGAVENSADSARGASLAGLEMSPLPNSQHTAAGGAKGNGAVVVLSTGLVNDHSDTAAAAPGRAAAAQVGHGHGGGGGGHGGGALAASPMSGRGGVFDYDLPSYDLPVNNSESDIAAHSGHQSAHHGAPRVNKHTQHYYDAKTLGTPPQNHHSVDAGSVPPPPSLLSGGLASDNTDSVAASYNHHDGYGHAGHINAAAGTGTGGLDSNGNPILAVSTEELDHDALRAVWNADGKAPKRARNRVASQAEYDAAEAAGALTVSDRVHFAAAMAWEHLKQHKTQAALGFVTGIAAGFFGGAFGINGPPIVMYVAYMQLDGTTARDTCAMIFLLNLPFMLGARFYFRIFKVDEWLVYLLITPVIVIALKIGEYLHNYLPTKAIFFGMQLFILISSITLTKPGSGAFGIIVAIIYAFIGVGVIATGVWRVRRTRALKRQVAAEADEAKAAAGDAEMNGSLRIEQQQQHQRGGGKNVVSVTVVR